MTPAKYSNGLRRVEQQYDADTPPSVAIVQAIATLENVNSIEEVPTDTGVILYDHVNPEALDRLVHSTDDVADVTVNLTLYGGRRYAVRIRDDGKLVVRKAA